MADELLENMEEVSSDSPKKEKKPKLTKEEKKQRKKDKKSAKKKSKGIVSKLLGLIIKLILLVLVLLLISVALVKNNVAGLAEGPLYDVLSKIPYVNGLIVDQNAVAEEENKKREELLMENDANTARIAELELQVETLTKENDDLNLEIERLSPLEDEYLAFREEKLAFDTEIANGDKVEYSEYYTSIYPENADEIYRQIIGDIENEETVTRYISRFEALDSGSCAVILEELIYTDLDLVVEVIDSMTVEKSAEVLENMDPVNSSTILKRLNP